MRFAHIVNPYDPGNSPGANRLQEFTLSSLVEAKRNADPGIEVEFCAAVFPEDKNFIPAEFALAKVLERSLADVAGLQMKKRLPLIHDILEGLKASGADFFIYTNMDIVLRPYFYSAVARILQHEKKDALIINRRRIPGSLIDTPGKIPSEKGLPHPGYDCFVFHRSLLEKFDMGKIAVGVPGIGFLFAHELFRLTDKCELLTEENLTYHFGMEIVKPWVERNAEQFQLAEIKSILRSHKDEFRVANFPGYHLPFFRRHKYWLMNPLFRYPMMFRLDLAKLFDGRSIDRKPKRESAWREWKLHQLFLA